MNDHVAGLAFEAHEQALSTSLHEKERVALETQRPYLSG